MGRLTLFIKGNLDVHDSLHSFRLGGEIVWNGINEVLRVSHPGLITRVKHETATRSEALRHATGVVPDALKSRSLPLGPYPPESQFSRAVFETKADAIVLSIQPDVIFRQMRHKREGYRLYLYDLEFWKPEDQAWLKAEFELVPRPEPAETMAHLTAVIEEIRKQSEAPVLIYNMSPMVPGENLHCLQGMGETLSTRIRKFNLALIGLSEATGISLIDVESVLARKGTDTLKLDTTHLTAGGYRLVAEEVVRVLEDLGVIGAG